MKRLIIISEGHTEEEFVKRSLAPFLFNYGVVSTVPIKVKTSRTQKGGLSNYTKFKNDIISILKKEDDVVISSLIDYFRLPTDFPLYNDIQDTTSVLDKVTKLETGLYQDIGDPRFIPYIQLHEFEALLFTDIKGFRGIAEFSSIENDKILESINQILTEYNNPELINSRPEFAPSKRISRIIPEFDKVLFGNIIIEENGMENLIVKCPRFKEWIVKLVFTVTGSSISFE